MADYLSVKGQFGNAPYIQVESDDLDVLAHAASLLKAKINSKRTARVDGSRAVGWMLTLYSLLGERRQDEIRSIVSVWRKEPVYQRYRTHCSMGHLYDDDNTLYNAGRRACRKCHAATVQQFRERANTPIVE